MGSFEQTIKLIKGDEGDIAVSTTLDDHYLAVFRCPVAEGRKLSACLSIRCCQNRDS